MASGHSANPALSDDGPDIPRGRGLPVILACAVVQGWALFGLHRAVDGGQWPATNVPLLLALYAVVVFLPLTLQLLAEQVRAPTTWWAMAVLAVAFAGFGLHEGAFIHLDRNGKEATDRLFPLLGILLVIWLQVLPFLQGRLAAGTWRYGYGVLFTKAWRNKLVLSEAGLFTALFWLLLLLWQELFALLGITFFEDLFAEPVFAYPVTALAFGIALHLIGSVERLTMATLEHVLSVLKWLAVLGAFIVVIFSAALLLELPGLVTGGKRAVPATWLLWLVAVNVLLLNAAYRDGAGPEPYPAWLGAAIRLAVPLTLVVVVTALYSIGLRTTQYGLTVERVWAFIVAGSALLYAAGYTWAAARRGPWMQAMARVNVFASVALVTVLALALTPVLSPYRLSADSQYRVALASESPGTLALTADGGVPPIFWLRFSGGGYGRERLQALSQVAEHPDGARLRAAASTALAAKNPVDLERDSWREALDSLRAFPPGRDLDPALRDVMRDDQYLPYAFRQRVVAGAVAGVYLDVDRDGEEEFLLLVPGGGRLFDRVGDGWQAVASVADSAEDDGWETMLVELAAGRVTLAEPAWTDVVIGQQRLRIAGEEWESSDVGISVLD